jgi:hypothetical protein
MDPIAVARVAALALLCHAPAVRAEEDPAERCRRVGTDDALRPLPPALVPSFLRAFGLERMPAEVAERTAYVRCDGGRTLACSTGANLPCGPADARRDMPEADAWCRANGDAGAGVVPAYVVGHATLYAWACRGGRAVPVRQVAHVDRRGFVAEYWRPLD